MAKPNGTDRGLQGSGTISPFPESPPELESVQTEDTALALQEAEFSILPDGRIVDLIRSANKHATLQFLVWDDGKMQVARHVDLEDTRLVVPSLDATVVSALGLPTMAKPCPPVGELYLQIISHVERYVHIAAESAFLVTAFILATWFADRLSIAPYLAVCGPPESGKTTLMRLLLCFCRRAIHVSDITRASLYRLAAQVRPTFLIDEGDFGRDRSSRDLQRLLRGGSGRGARILSNGQAFENFGPKVIASRVPSGDAALNSRAIHITMTPSDRVLPQLDWEAEEKLAADLQPKLEMFRLLHYRSVQTSQYAGFLKFPPRLRDCARVLGAPLLGDEGLLEQLGSALESQVHTARLERFQEPEYIVMLALFSLCHVARYDLYVSQVADAAKKIFHNGGHRYTAKMVGSILNNSLGFSTLRRGEGYRIPLTAEVRRRIHDQAKRMGLKRSDVEPVTNVEGGFVGQLCDLCSEFGLMMDHGGRSLVVPWEFNGTDSCIACTNCGFRVRSDDVQCPRCDTPRQTTESSRSA